MSPEEMRSVAEAMRLTREQSRGYATFFEWPLDRDLEELQIACLLSASLEQAGRPHFTSLRSRGRGDDPPDVEGRDVSFRSVAIEVTELVDGPAIKAHRSESGGAFKVWSRDEFLSRLRSQLERKAGRARSLKGGPYDGGYVVVIFTDEPDLQRDTVGAHLKDVSFEAIQAVSHAYLLLSYDPSTQGYPHFELPLDA